MRWRGCMTYRSNTMELFSEIYNCYYQVVDSILKKAEKYLITEKEMNQVCSELGFAESGLYILPKLISQEWKLLASDDGLSYRSLTGAHADLPLTLLQRSWLKTLLLDDRFRLFFTDEELPVIEKYVRDAALLWEPDSFHYYDQYTKGDCYTSPEYREHFRTLLTAIPRRQYVTISYQSQKGNRITHHYLPLRLEYSAKNDQFRLLAVPENERHSIYIRVINLRGITKAVLLPRFDEQDFDLASLIQKTYYQEPVRLLIKNQRNALERAMLHFSNYEKKTKKIDEDTWECLIYYNHSMETELLIEVLSFGPAIKVTGPESFLTQIKRRLQRQLQLFRTEPPVTSSRI